MEQKEIKTKKKRLALVESTPQQQQQHQYRNNQIYLFLEEFFPLISLSEMVHVVQEGHGVNVCIQPRSR